MQPSSRSLDLAVNPRRRFVWEYKVVCGWKLGRGQPETGSKSRQGLFRSPYHRPSLRELSSSLPSCLKKNLKWSPFLISKEKKNRSHHAPSPPCLYANITLRLPRHVQDDRIRFGESPVGCKEAWSWELPHDTNQQSFRPRTRRGGPLLL